MGRKRVLIIDDESDLLDLMRMAFEQRQFKVFTAEDGQEGLKLASAKKPDAIVLDIKMPKLNGYEFLTAARKDARLARIPVLVLTSLTEASGPSDEEWGRRLEVGDFATKPVEPFALVARVERMLGIESTSPGAPSAISL